MSVRFVVAVRAHLSEPLAECLPEISIKLDFIFHEGLGLKRD